MKTARLLYSLALASAWAAQPAGAVLFVAMEADLRGEYTDRDGLEGEINSLGGSLRKVFSDRTGDRFILQLQAEAADNFSELLLQQGYGELKGPMGMWNIAVGRVPMPWGLLTDWSPDRMPYKNPYPDAGVIVSDNGVLFSGTRGMADYGLALSQGYGMRTVRDFPGPGALTGRIGLTPGISGDFSAGLSGSAGTAFLSEHGHGTGEIEKERRVALALDATLHMGRGTYRVEGGGRKTRERWHGTIFAAAEYALLPKLWLQGAGQVYTDMAGDGRWRMYAGAGVPAGFATIRGGYEYEKSDKDNHRAVVQVYRLFSFSR